MLSAVRPLVKTVFATVMLAAALGAVACYWYRYADLMQTHLEVLAAMADKFCTGAGVRSRMASVPEEYRYPLERAQDFARVAAKRCPERRSLAAFRRVLPVYAEVVGAGEAGVSRCHMRARLDRRIRRVGRWLEREPRRCG
jgi:hypothetical protein